MSSDDIWKRIAKCRRDFDNMSKQACTPLPALIEKMEALCLLKKTERSGESEAEKNRPPAPPAITQEDMMARYKELEANIRSFLKAFGKKKMEAGSSSRALPPAVDE